MNKVTVTAIGAYHPCDKITNEFFESRLDTSDQWIRERTGIESRYFTKKDEYTGDMCVKAALDMKENYRVDFSDVDMILVATMTADHVVPNVACQIQDSLGIRSTGAIDLTCACSGFCYAMALAKGLIASGMHKKILVFGAETMSRILDFTDRNTCILFGDAAACVLVEATDGENTVFESICGTDGSMGKELYMSMRSNRANGEEILADGFVHQNGRAVYKWAVTTLAQGLEDLAAKNGLTLDTNGLSPLLHRDWKTWPRRTGLRWMMWTASFLTAPITGCWRLFSPDSASLWTNALKVSANTGTLPPHQYLWRGITALRKVA